MLYNGCMVRCTRCHFLFEPATRGLLPPCGQCGGVTMLVLKIEEFGEEPSASPTMKLPVVRVAPPQ
jgi:predicted  nucleic acid-binding Zn-ribbon protein